MMASLNVDRAEPNLAFSLTEGGPGSAFMKRLHLVHPELGTGSPRTALVLMGLTWLPLFILCLLEGLVFSGAKIPFFYDIAAHTRFLLAVPVLVLADIPVGARLRQVVRHFVAAHLIREDELVKFGETILEALRFRDSHVAEMIVLILAYIATYSAVTGFSFQKGGSWFMPVSGQGLSPVGYWYAFVALPIFQFLIFRWIYRMVVWSRFLWKVSKFDLLLTPTHPDAAGGLAFLGKGLIPFGVVLFALSAVVASAIARNMLFNGGKLEDYQWSYLVLFLVGLVIFAGPMLIFVPKLITLKQRGLMEYGALGSEYTQAFHRRWVDKTQPTEEPLLGTGDIQSLADLGNSFEIIRKMKVLPVDLSDFIAIVLPGLIPALPLAATVMPLGQIVKTLLKLVA
ncbi:MAG TPA: hypothetical protein VGY99_28310 [Candidatus Binataceae bacterium]|jgi:hypothetical protein|nr:hypothetical protein [Candidatus Binataceae bacterium]